MSFRRAAVSVLFAGLGLSAVVAQTRPRPVGLIDRLSGQWVLLPENQLVSRGDMVYDHQTIASDDPAQGSVSIILFGSDRRWEKRCSANATCPETYRPGNTPSSQSRGFLAFFLDYWTPDRAVPPELMGSRAASDSGPVHAVAERPPSGAISLVPALTAMKPGSYEVQLTPAPDSSVRNTEGWRGIVTVGTGDRADISTVPAGLYVVTVMSRSKETIGTPALLLVLDRTEVDLQRAWNEAQAEMQNWKGADPLTVSTFLARALYSIDGQRTR